MNFKIGDNIIVYHIEENMKNVPFYTVNFKIGDLLNKVGEVVSLGSDGGFIITAVFPALDNVKAHIGIDIKFKKFNRNKNLEYLLKKL